MNLLPSLLANAAAMHQLRRDLHAHPEIGFKVERTAAIIAARLRQAGIEVHEGIGKTGVVGVIRGRAAGPEATVGLRADMDALPILERNAFAHKSVYEGCMHGCGHDGHVAMLLAASEHLAATRDFDGSVVVIFQPAEEGGGGAKAMIDEGLFERFPMGAVFGLHNWPGQPVGDLAVSPGPVMASSNEFSIQLVGRGGHAAMPQLCIDPVVLAAQLVGTFQTIITRNCNPTEAAVISVTVIQAGQTDNVIADSCLLRGTVRTFSLEALDLIERRMREITQGLCSAFGATHTFEFLRKEPPTINTGPEAQLAREVMVQVVGEHHTLAQMPSTGAEDFAYMLAKKPGAYAFIGNGNGEHRAPLTPSGHLLGPCSLHNPHYDFNDEIIPIGATYWVTLAQTWLARYKAGGGHSA